MSLIIAALLVVMLVCSSDELAAVPSCFFCLQGGDSVEDDVFAVSSCCSIVEKFCEVGYYQAQQQGELLSMP